MARNRANVAEGQYAYVGDLRFGPRQLLPVGTIEYQVKGFFAFTEKEQEDFGIGGIPYSFTVPVGTPQSEIINATIDIVAEAIDAQDEFAYASLEESKTMFPGLR